MFSTRRIEEAYREYDDEVQRSDEHSGSHPQGESTSHHLRCCHFSTWHHHAFEAAPSSWRLVVSLILSLRVDRVLICHVDRAGFFAISAISGGM